MAASRRIPVHNHCVVRAQRITASPLISCITLHRFVTSRRTARHALAHDAHPGHQRSLSFASLTVPIARPRAAQSGTAARGHSDPRLAARDALTHIDSIIPLHESVVGSIGIAAARASLAPAYVSSLTRGDASSHRPPAAHAHITLPLENVTSGPSRPGRCACPPGARGPPSLSAPLAAAVTQFSLAFGVLLPSSPAMRTSSPAPIVMRRAPFLMLAAICDEATDSTCDATSSGLAHAR